jgi:hypothetical protein
MKHGLIARPRQICGAGFAVGVIVDQSRRPDQRASRKDSKAALDFLPVVKRPTCGRGRGTPEFVMPWRPVERRTVLALSGTLSAGSHR